tara:strand:+ start:39207 stop:40202 length:996 start_codon:yes stop_codon:yes gene_type:complete
VKVLVIGCGSIGSRHSRLLKSLCDVAVWDTDNGRAQALADTLNVNCFSNFDAAKNWQPDGVVIAVPNEFHVSVALPWLGHVRSILVEKPLAATVTDAERLMTSIKGSGTKVYGACNMRFHPGVRMLKQGLESIGTPLFARLHYGNSLPNMRPNSDYRKLYCASRVAGGGVILDAIHELDYIKWLLGPATMLTAAAGRLSDLDIDVEDWACLTLCHESGPRTEIQLDYLRPYKRRGGEIVGSMGAVSWNSEGKSPEIIKSDLVMVSDTSPRSLLDQLGVNGDDAFVSMYQCFLSAMQSGGSSDLASIEEAFDTLRLAWDCLGAVLPLDAGRK